MSEDTPIARQSLAKTMGVAVAIALVCSAAVTTAVQYLRPVQLAYSDLTRTTAIVRAAYGPQASDSNSIDAFLALDRFLVDPQNGKVTPAMSNASGEHLVPVFAAQSADDQTFVFPVTAKGMWSDIECYIALDSTLSTIVRLQIYQHAETPGIGDRIEDPQWLQRFVGKEIYDQESHARLHVGKSASVPAQHRVDAITGATISSVAIGAALRDTFATSGMARARAALQQLAINPEGDRQ